MNLSSGQSMCRRLFALAALLVVGVPYRPQEPVLLASLLALRLWFSADQNLATARWVADMYARANPRRVDRARRAPVQSRRARRQTRRDARAVARG